MKNVILVDSNAEYYSSIYTSGCVEAEPLGLLYLAGVANEKGYETTIIQQNHMNKKMLLEEILKSDPWIVGFSTFAYNIDYCRDLALNIKKTNPKIYTVFGGYHASAVPDIVKDPSIDFVVIGEGELTFIDLLETLQLNKEIMSVEGIAYFDGNVKVTPSRTPISDLDTLPYPSRNAIEVHKTRDFGLHCPPPSKQGKFQVTYSRGCSNRCNYCFSPNMQGHKVRWRKPEKVIGEIQNLKEAYGANYIYFTDLTFNADEKKANNLCDTMIENDIDIHWFCSCNSNISVDLLETMKAAGCSRIHVGIESMSGRTLHRIGRGYTQRVTETLRHISDLGFIVRGYFMIGYPWETRADLDGLKVALPSLPIDDLRLSFFTPFPGLPIFEKLNKKGLLTTEDYSLYTTDVPVVKVKGLTAENLLEIRDNIFRGFYQSKEYEKRKEEKIKKCPHLKQSYDEFFMMLYENNVL